MVWVRLGLGAELSVLTLNCRILACIVCRLSIVFGMDIAEPEVLCGLLVPGLTRPRVLRPVFFFRDWMCYSLGVGSQGAITSLIFL